MSFLEPPVLNQVPSATPSPLSAPPLVVMAQMTAFILAQRTRVLSILRPQKTSADKDAMDVGAKRARIDSTQVEDV
jgi:hypothetical protein